MNRRRWSLSVALPRPHWESDEFAQYTPDARATMLIVCQTTRNYHPSDIYPPPPPRCINDSYVRLPMLHAGENSFGPARGCLLLLFEHATSPSFFPSHLFLPLCAFNPRFLTFYRILFFLEAASNLFYHSSHPVSRGNQFPWRLINMD